MAEKVGKIVLDFDVTGLEDLTSLSRGLKSLKKSLQPAEGRFKGLAKAIGDVTKFTPKTISQFKKKERVLKSLREEVRAGGRGFKILGKAIDENRAKLQAFTKTAKKGAFSGIGVGGKAAAGAAIGGAASRFLPAGATTGAFAAIGAGAGPAGIATGALIGLTVDAGAAFVQAGKSAAEYSAQIKRLEVALRGVTKSQTEFNKAQKVIKSVSKELNVPIAAATQQFTTLTASVIGAGGSVDEAEKVFRGVSEAIKATGGDAEDVKSAIRAMSQIFGKGKVSAEELQGQLGERLPGAVTKFALATNRTLPQLQKDLRDGTVGLNDVMKFVVKLSEDHAEAAREMARSSADAGQRMQVTFDEMKKNVGDILQPLGAEIQDFTEVAVDNLNRFIKKIKEALKIGDEFELNNIERNIKRLEKLLGKRAFTGAGDFFLQSLPGFAQFEAIKGLGNKLMSDEQRSIFEDQLEAFKLEKENLLARKRMMDQLKSGVSLGMDFGSSAIGLGSNVFGEDSESGNVFEDPVNQATANDTKKAKDILDKYRESVKQVNQDIANSFVNTFKKMEDALVEFVLQGQLNFRKLAQSIIADITRIMIRSKVIQPLTGMLGNLFNPTPKNTVNPFTTDFGGLDFGSFLDLGTNVFGDSNKNSLLGPISQNLPSSPKNIIPSLNKTPSNTMIPSKLPKFPGFKFADGGVIAKNKIVPYAKGGLIERPTLFPLSNGAALAGEASVEAIMPLRRGRDGKLGVEASGGNIGNITVNVDASGSSVEGDTNQSQELGNILGAAIQAELIRQKRPGGLLG